MRGKSVLIACVITLSGASHASAIAATQASVADLASSLREQRDVCTNMAAEAKRTHDLALYESNADLETADLKAEMDARVYAVGHGQRQTTEYYAQLLQNATAKQQAKDKVINDTFLAAGEKLKECVIELKEKGKATYVNFKKRSVNATVISQAETLMTAWLANVNEISTAAPNGEDPSFTAWKAAIAQAEVSAL